jgi:hypothetical protein
MENSMRNQTEIQELQDGQSYAFTEHAETNEGTRRPIKDLETMLGIIVLLLACLGLAALAHIIV